MAKQKIDTPAAPAAIGCYSQAIQQDNTFYFSGQIPLDPLTMMLVSDDFAGQTRQVFLNLKAVAAAAGLTMSHLVKLTVYLTDIGKTPVVNEIMSEIFETPYPARTTIQVVALPKGAQIEVDAIGIK